MDDNKVGYLTDENGRKSFRRLAGFILLIDMVINCSASIATTIISGGIDWKVCAITSGLPLMGVIFMVFFTSWSDISSVLSSIKK